MIKEKANFFYLDHLLPSIDFTASVQEKLACRKDTKVKEVVENVEAKNDEVVNHNEYEKYFFDLLDNQEDYTISWKYK